MLLQFTFCVDSWPPWGQIILQLCYWSILIFDIKSAHFIFVCAVRYCEAAVMSPSVSLTFPLITLSSWAMALKSALIFSTIYGYFICLPFHATIKRQNLISKMPCSIKDTRCIWKQAESSVDDSYESGGSSPHPDFSSPFSLMISVLKKGWSTLRKSATKLTSICIICTVCYV